MDEALTKELHNTQTYPDGTDWLKAFKAEQAKWLQEASRLLTASATASHKYIDLAVTTYDEAEKTRGEKLEKQWDEEYANDKRPVEPVSDYGKSNIDEAFAEVFAHYIMGEDMTRDQIESFKSILKTAAERVLARVESPYRLTYAR